MKNIFLIFTILFLNSICFADELRVPFSCWPKQYQEAFLNTGRKLDLHGEDRTKDSWGYILNEGNSFKIFTYQSLTKEDFDTVQNIIFDIEKRNP